MRNTLLTNDRDIPLNLSIFDESHGFSQEQALWYIEEKYGLNTRKLVMESLENVGDFE